MTFRQFSTLRLNNILNELSKEKPVGLRRKYKKKPTSFITAVQLDLDTEGFTYNKWGGKQVCKKDDWLVNNNGDT